VRRLIVTADDFGRDVAVNQAVERAHREGILSTASLMVGAPAAADAIARARRLKSLNVGLHLVLIDGSPVLPPGELDGLVGRNGRFDDNPLRAGLRFFFRPGARRHVAAEIRAQFEAFAATGLALHHVDAHKHMHLHPTVGKLLIAIGRQYGLRAVRVPAEPPSVLKACGQRVSPGQKLLHGWTRLLRRRVQAAGMQVNDHCFGIAWSGHMTASRLLRLASNLPEGVSEIYFHPATQRDRLLSALMPDYEHEAELAALLDPRLRQLLQNESFAA
jgi:hopanoid biosynthesis associated protein HpnK